MTNAWFLLERAKNGTGARERAVESPGVQEASSSDSKG